MKKFNAFVIFFLSLVLVTAYAGNNLGQEGDQCNSKNDYCYTEKGGRANCSECKAKWIASHEGDARRAKGSVAPGTQIKGDSKKSEIIGIGNK